SGLTENKQVEVTEETLRKVKDEEPEGESKEAEADSHLLHLGDKDVDDIFSGLTENSQPEVTEESLAKFKNKEDGEEEKTEPTGEAQREEDSRLLHLGDDDVDDIFSGLTEKSQSDVSEETLSKLKQSSPTAELETPAPEKAEEGGGLLNLGDKDVDDIFSGLTENAQPEVNAETLAMVKEEPTGESEAPAQDQAKEEGSGLLNLGDKDVDDIFSGLTENAQPDFSAENLSKVKQGEEEPAERKETAASSEEASGGLLNLGDKDIDHIFSGLTENAQPEVTEETISKVKSKDEEESKAEPANADSGLFNLKDKDVDDIFSGLTEEGQDSVTKESLARIQARSQELAAVASSDSPTKESTAESDDPEETSAHQPIASPIPPGLKEFGRLSNRSAVAPTPEGTNAGTMKTVGKLLLDHDAVEQIIKTGEEKKRLGRDLATARIITVNRGAGIAELLTKIDKNDGVSGSLIVGHDGMVMASTVTGEWSKEILGALSTALLSTTNLTTRKLEIGKLRQMVLITSLSGVLKTTVLTDVDVGILAVFVENADVVKIDILLESIHKTIHGSASPS
ncbi:MAG: hypothetical protein K2Z81_16045, partial [Cyanobacteria bacterium]|nr:hypothetical protein [Cyanobacteriota bacterium]